MKRDEKYACFRQGDISTDSLFSRIIIYLFCGPLLVFRVLSAAIILALLQLHCFLVFLLIPTSSPLHKRVLLFGTSLAAYGILACSSILWVNHERPKVCFKKYLGDDWEPTYEGQSCNIFNHSAWIDTFTMMTCAIPSFIAKRSVRNLPFVGYSAWRCGTLFLDRVDKNSRAAMYDSIKEHQESAERGEKPPLNLAPEGGTTNGTAVIKFKKGAFAALKSVKIYGFTYSSTIVPVESGVIPMESHAILLAGNPFATCTIREMPVFKPNEFFWKNHMQEGEEKVDTYMRVMRKIMAECLGQKLIDIGIEEKFDYRALIWPSKYKGE